MEKKLVYFTITLLLISLMAVSVSSASASILGKFITGKVAANVSVGVTASGIWTDVTVTPGNGNYGEYIPTANGSTTVTFTVTATNEDKTSGNVNSTGYATVSGISGISNVALSCSSSGDYTISCTGGSFGVPYYKGPANGVSITAHVFSLYPVEGTGTGYFNWTELTSMSISASSFSGNTSTGANATLTPTLVVYDAGNKNLTINGSSSELTGTAGTIPAAQVWLGTINIGTNVQVDTITYGEGAATTPKDFTVYAHRGLGVGSVSGTTNITAI